MAMFWKKFGATCETYKAAAGGCPFQTLAMRRALLLVGVAAGLVGGKQRSHRQCHHGAHMLRASPAGDASDC